MVALVLIDIQNDYFSGGNMELVDSDVAVKNAARLLSRFREKNLHVIHIQHISMRSNATFFLPNTKGVNFHNLVLPNNNEIVILKKHPNIFYETTLINNFNEYEIDSIVISGMMTHMCIDTSVRAAYDFGIKCTLAHDACATKDLNFNGKIIPAHYVQATYMASLSGVFATIKDTETICREL